MKLLISIVEILLGTDYVVIKNWTKQNVLSLVQAECKAT